jgi:catechol 2,3-dioxygenase-like lactoylglutathione lyase family enzyme
MLTSLDHLVIAVRDLSAATATYTALLGRAPSWRGEHPSGGTANTLFRLDRTYVELLSPVGEGVYAAPLRARLEREGEGPYLIAFGTDDAAACAVELRARGLPASEPVDGVGCERDRGVERRWRILFLPSDATRGVPMFVVEHRSPPEALPPAVASGAAAAAVAGVDHVVIMTADPDAACALYRDRLGLRLAFDRVFEERRVRLLFFRIGGVTVELAAALGAADATAPDRFWGISWRVPDVDAARARLVAAGFDVSDVRPGNKAGTRVCTVRRETHSVATLLLEPGPAPARDAG